MISDYLQFHNSLIFNLNGYLLLMWMFSLHHDVMVEATRKLSLARMGLKQSKTNVADASLKLRKVPKVQILIVSRLMVREMPQ